MTGSRWGWFGGKLHLFVFSLHFELKWDSGRALLARGVSWSAKVLGGPEHNRDRGVVLSVSW